MVDRNSIDYWKTQYKLGVKFRKDVGLQDKWPVWKQYYRNKFKSVILPVNVIFPLVRSVVPRVYFRNPRVVVSPLKEGYGLQAKIIESIDNYLLRRLGLKNVVKKIVQDSCIVGTGIGKSGFDSEYGYDADNSREDSEFVKFLKDNGIWSDDTEINEFSETVIPGFPWYLPVNPANFVVPYGCTDLKSAPFVIHRIARHIDYVKADPKYDNTKNLSPTHTLANINKDEDDLHGTQLISTDGVDVDQVILYEVYDVSRKRIKVFAHGHDKWLRDDPDVLQAAGLPFDALVFNPDSDWFWGISDIHFLEPQQLELNEIRTQFREQRKHSIIKFLVAAGAITAESMEKLINGEPDCFVEVNLQGLRSLQEVIKEFQPHYTDFLVQAGLVVRQDMREMVGFSRNQFGEFDASTRRTATEAAIVNEASMIRVDERRDMAADLIVDAVRRFNKYIFMLWRQEKVAQIVGPQGTKYWVSYTGSQLQGEYDIQVDIDSARPMSSAQRRQDAMELLRIGTSIPPELQLINLPGLLAFVVEQFEGADPYRVLGPNTLNAIGANEIPQAISFSDLSSRLGMLTGGTPNASL